MPYINKFEVLVTVKSEENWLILSAFEGVFTSCIEIQETEFSSQIFVSSMTYIYFRFG